MCSQHIDSAQANQHTGTPILFTWKTSQLERKNYRPKPPKYSSTIIKWGYNSSSLESTRGSDTTRFGTQELGSGTISPKMVEQQLEGDKVVDLGLHNLVGRARCLI